MPKLGVKVAIAMACRVGSAFANLIFLPLYRPFLGNDAYGLIAYAISISCLLTFVGGALEPVFVREIAMRKAKGERVGVIVRAHEYLNGATFFLLLLLSGFLASKGVSGLKLGELDPALATLAIQLVILGSAVDFLTRPYIAALIGRQQHHQPAIILASRSWLEGFIGFVVLYLTRDVALFFWSYLAVRVLVLLVSAVFVWSGIRQEFWIWKVPKSIFFSVRAFVSLNLLVAAIATFSGLAQQRMIGSSIEIALLGLYNLAMLPAITAGNVADNIKTAMMPRLCEQQVEESDQSASVSLIIGGELLSVILLPLLFSLVFYPFPLYLAWQRDLTIMDVVCPLGVWLALGSAFIAIRGLVATIEYTRGKMMIALVSVIASVVVFLPMMHMGLKWNGAQGAAISVAIYALVECLLVSYFSFRLYMDKEQFWAWLGRCFVRPVVACLVVGGCLYFFFPESKENLLFAFLYVGGSFAAVVAVSPLLRGYARDAGELLKAKMAKPQA